MAVDEPKSQPPETGRPAKTRRRSALRFVILVGVMSLFADFTYEGARSVIGPYLAVLGASAFVVSAVTGFGELLGYGLRLVSGRLSDRTREFWPITIFGYVLQMSVVPLLAIAGNWQIAALFIILERVGKATRNPPRDAMLAHAGHEVGGYGWAFGLHEALDQAGALIGPLVAAAVLAVRSADYKLAFAVLAIPASITLVVLAIARVSYPRPEDLEARQADLHTEGMSHMFWVYLAAAALVAAGFADFPLIAFRFQDSGTVTGASVPTFYAIAMAVSGAGSLAFGKLFDRRGIGILVPLTIVCALYAPLVFLGGFVPALLGASLWGLGMGVHESIVPAAVAHMVSPDRRASAYGLFTAAYGIAWFAGSLALGALYTLSAGAAVTFAIVAELAAIPFLMRVRRQFGTW
jgi:predicted MFS family arabinose efflux permease